MKDDWIDVHDRLPDKSGYYIVYAPEYVGSAVQKVVNGMVFSKFIAKTGSWSIERNYKELVEYWMPLPKKPKGADI